MDFGDQTANPFSLSGTNRNLLRKRVSRKSGRASRACRVSAMRRLAGPRSLRCQRPTTSASPRGCSRDREQNRAPPPSGKREAGGRHCGIAL